jgi:hypothetical protein
MAELDTFGAALYHCELSLRPKQLRLDSFLYLGALHLKSQINIAFFESFLQLFEVGNKHLFYLTFIIPTDLENFIQSFQFSDSCEIIQNLDFHEIVQFYNFDVSLGFVVIQLIF